MVNEFDLSLVTPIYRGSRVDVINWAYHRGVGKMSLRNLFSLLHCIPSFLHCKSHLGLSKPSLVCHITIVEIVWLSYRFFARLGSHRKLHSQISFGSQTHSKCFTLPPTERPIIGNFSDSNNFTIGSKVYDISQRWNSPLKLYNIICFCNLILGYCG